MPQLTTQKQRDVDPCVDAGWAALAAERGELFHSPAWMRVLSASYGVEPRALMLHDPDGRPTSGLVYCQITDPRGSRRVSLPFSDYCDPLLARDADWMPLADDWLSAPGVARMRCLHARAPLDDRRLAENGWAYWHATDTRRSLGQIWSELRPAARRGARRAERAGVTVRAARDARDLRLFFELHLRLRKSKYRLLAQPYRFVEALWSEFVERDQGSLLLAEHDGEVIAGIFLLEARSRLYYKLGASDPHHLDMNPNDLLFWRALEHAHARGLEHLDFGVSDHDQPGLVRFKRKFATQEGRVTFLQRPAVDPPPPGCGDWQDTLHQMTRLLTRPDVADELTERAGDCLYRHFS